MDINNNDGTPPPLPPPHPPPPGNNDDPIDIDDDMEDEETRRMMEQEMEYLTELQLLYDLSSPAARKEYLRKQPWFHDLTSGEKEEYLSVIEKISHADAHANAVADTNADTDDAAETGYTSNELNFNEENVQLYETSVTIHEEIDATNTSSSASPELSEPIMRQETHFF
jgi:hypothetical protein